MLLQHPHQYPRRILLAVTGLSPQVVTETLYALAVSSQPAFQPTEIHLITTVEGARRARLTLLSEQPGWFHRLRQDYNLPLMQFDSDSIHCITGMDGELLDDIRSPQDSLACADFITQLVRSLTDDESAALHVSIAGGRKTMGFFLGYALSMFGRPQDRLSHVLVSEPYENSWNFFYPTPYENIIETASKALADARDAQLTLAEIPFVSLRHGLPVTILKGGAGFADAVQAAQAALGPAELRLDLKTRTVRASGKTFKLPPAELAMLTIFARRAINGDPPLQGPPKDSPEPEWADRYLIELRNIVGQLGDIDATTVALRNGMDGGYFSPRLSKLHRALEANLGPAAAVYRLDGVGGRPRRYRLNLLPEAIEIVP